MIFTIEMVAARPVARKMPVGGALPRMH